MAAASSSLSTSQKKRKNERTDVVMLYVVAVVETETGLANNRLHARTKELENCSVS
jgi:hypothetical protein